MKEAELLIIHHKTNDKVKIKNAYLPSKTQASISLRAEGPDEGSCCPLGCAAESRSGAGATIQYACEGMQRCLNCCEYHIGD
jgi:hypothetical protein